MKTSTVNKKLRPCHTGNRQQQSWLSRCRVFILLTFAAGILVFLPISANLYAAVPDKRPNFIIIFLDDLGYGDLSSYGGKAISTPAIDSLAQEGVRLTDFYASAAICAPSRAGLLTGRYPIRSGVVGNLYPKDEPFQKKFAREYLGTGLKSLGTLDLQEGGVVPGIPQKEILLGEALKTAGYRTGMIGKWHLGDYSKNPSFNPVRNGFDFYFGVPHSNDMFPYPLYKNEEMVEADIGLNQARLTGMYTEEAVNFIRESKDQPFFLHFAHTFPHQPLYASDKFANKSKGGKFGDAVEEIDWSVSRILETLKELGIDDNTMIVFSSDNGPWFEGSSGHFRGRKGQSYEGGFHVPMIARWPGQIPAGTECDTPLMNIDIYPTFLSLAGVDLPQDRIIDGRNMMDQLKGNNDESPHDALYFYHFETLEGIRVGDWKYFRQLNRYVWPVPLDAASVANKLAEKQLGNERWPLLHNLQIDPGESYNVMNAYPDVAKKLAKRMLEWEAKIKDPQMPPQ